MEYGVKQQTNKSCKVAQYYINKLLTQIHANNCICEFSWTAFSSKKYSSVIWHKYGEPEWSDQTGVHINIYHPHVSWTMRQPNITLHGGSPVHPTPSNITATMRMGIENNILKPRKCIQLASLGKLVYNISPISHSPIPELSKIYTFKNTNYPNMASPTPLEKDFGKEKWQ